MTEVEWHVSDDPQAMLGVLRGCAIASERKLRLYAHVCATSAIQSQANSEQYEHILTVAEKFVEGMPQPEEVRRAEQEGFAIVIASSQTEAMIAGAVSCTIERDAFRGACGVVANLLLWEQEVRGHTNASQYAEFLRCVFGNPYRGLRVGFRPVRLEPEWRTSTVVTMSHQIYQSRDFSPMPILADALQDVGCDSDDILNHLRGPGPHTRGCWPLDLVLAKQ